MSGAGVAPAMVDCPTCGTPFRAQLTRGQCPVCGWGLQAAVRRSWFPGADQLDILVVVTVTVLNLGLLAVLALMLSRQ